MNEAENIEMRMLIMKREEKKRREREISEFGNVGMVVNTFKRAYRKWRYPDNAPAKGVWKTIDSLDNLSRYVDPEEMAELIQRVVDIEKIPYVNAWYLHKYQILLNGEIQCFTTRIRGMDGLMCPQS